MAKLSLCVIILVIGMFQLCAANPNTMGNHPNDGESDVTELFTPAELKRAKSAEISDHELIDGTKFGLTVEEIIKLHPLKKIPNVKKNNVTFEFVGTLCSKLVSAHQTATNYTRSQAMHLNDSIYLVVKKLPTADHADIFRTTICPYVSQPDLYEMEASRFGSKLLPYLKIHYLKIKAQKASKVGRPKVVMEICCTYDGKDYSDPGITRDSSNFIELPEYELNKFTEYWNDYEAQNTSISLEKVCDFVKAKNSSDECRKAVTFYDY